MVGRVPHEDAQVAPAAAPDRHEIGLRLGRGDAGRGEHLAGKGHADPERSHRLKEQAAAEVPALDLVDQSPERRLVHG